MCAGGQRFIFNHGGGGGGGGVKSRKLELMERSEENCPSPANK